MARYRQKGCRKLEMSFRHPRSVRERVSVFLFAQDRNDQQRQAQPGKNDGGQKSHNRCATVHRLVCSGIIGCSRCCNGKHHGAGFGRCIGLGDGGIDCFNRCVCQRDGQLGPCADKPALAGTSGAVMLMSSAVKETVATVFPSATKVTV